MPSAMRSAVAPIYLLACLLLGGSAQGIWQNAVLQLAGVAILAWVAASPAEEELPGAARPVLLLAVIGIVIAAVQLVPLPPALWAHGIGTRLAAGYDLLGLPHPFLPISLTPYASVGALLALIPPLAMFCAILRLGPYRGSWLAAALIAGAVAGIMLGALQVVEPGLDSPWYPYRETNHGVAVGFFANANHMANLLVISLPFLAALTVAGRTRNIQRYSALVAIAGGAALLIIAGIALNGSLAGYALALPVIGLSVLIAVPTKRSLRTPVAGLAAIALIGALGALASTSIGGNRIGQDASTSVQSRETILKTTSQAIRDTMPLGSGLGSFVKVYPLYESPASVTTEYVVHAHNDYAELVLELGLPGVILIVIFLIWWAGTAKAAWSLGGGGPYARAASVASGAILVHSLVDFPLRTAAISSCFAMCLALMVSRRPEQRQAPNDLRPSRHLIVA